MSDEVGENDNVVYLDAVERGTLEDISTSQILEQAKSHIDEDALCIVLAWQPDDHLYAATSKSQVPEILYLLEKTKEALLRDFDG